MRSRILIGLSAVALAFGVAGCSNGGGSTESSASGSSCPAAENGVYTVKVGASPVPHAKILQYLESSGEAKKAGLKIDVVEFQDYVKPNMALKDGEIDANYYQTVPYLDDQKKEFPEYKDFQGGKGIHLEPLGLYPGKVKNLDDLKDGATIGIINEPTNQGRALQLLIDKGLLKAPKGDLNVLSVNADPESNPHKFVFKEVEGPQLARVLNDVDVALINGNFAQAAGLAPKDALAIESTENNPAANILVWKGEECEGVKKLDELLHSDATKKYIEETWADKSVIPAF